LIFIDVEYIYMSQVLSWGQRTTRNSWQFRDLL